MAARCRRVRNPLQTLDLYRPIPEQRPLQQRLGEQQQPQQEGDRPFQQPLAPIRPTLESLAEIELFLLFPLFPHIVRLAPMWK